MANPTALPELEIDLETQKREIAYRLWEDEGCPEGKSEEHWAKACLIVMDLDSHTTEPPTWLQKQAESGSNGEIATAPIPRNSFEESLELLRTQIAGKTAA